MTEHRTSDYSSCTDERILTNVGASHDNCTRPEACPSPNICWSNPPIVRLFQITVRGCGTRAQIVRQYHSRTDEDTIFNSHPIEDAHSRLNLALLADHHSCINVRVASNSRVLTNMRPVADLAESPHLRSLTKGCVLTNKRVFIDVWHGRSNPQVEQQVKILDTDQRSKHLSPPDYMAPPSKLPSTDRKARCAINLHARIPSVQDVLHPSIVYSAVFVAYFAMGLVGDLNRAALFRVTGFPLLLLTVGLTAFLIGVPLGRRLIIRLAPPVASLPIPWRAVSIGFIILGLIGTTVLIITGQIGAADEAIRVSISPLVGALVAMLWFGGLLLAAFHLETWEKKQRNFIAITAVLLALAAFAGYRTPLVVILLIATLQWHYLVRPISARALTTAALIIVLVLGGISVVRLATTASIEEITTITNPFGEVVLEGEWDEETLREAVNFYPPWLLEASATPVAGRLALGRIISYVEHHGPLGGELHLAILRSVAPGVQQSSRSIVTSVVNTFEPHQTRSGLSTTPSIIGQFYLEAGLAGVLFGMVFLGVAIGAWYQFAVKRPRRTPAQIFGYAFALAVMLMGIHSGILDPVIFALGAVALFLTVAPGRPRQESPVAMEADQ